MFPGSTSGLSLVKILSGLSKSLNIAREVIPIYQQAKPMISNAKKAFSFIKEINKSPTNTNNKVIKNTASKSSIQVIQNNNNPTFFK